MREILAPCSIFLILNGILLAIFNIDLLLNTIIMNKKFYPVTRCGGWDDPDSCWASVRDCVRRKRDVLSGKNKLADCDQCDDAIKYADGESWGCPACNRVFEHFGTSTGRIKNIQKGGVQQCGDSVHNTRGEIPQTDIDTCPYCGFKAEGYDWNPMYDLLRMP